MWDVSRPRKPDFSTRHLQNLRLEHSSVYPSVTADGSAKFEQNPSERIHRQPENIVPLAHWCGGIIIKWLTFKLLL